MFLPRLTAIISDIANDVETDKLKGLLNFFLFGYDVILFESFPPPALSLFRRPQLTFLVFDYIRKKGGRGGEKHETVLRLRR